MLLLLKNNIAQIVIRNFYLFFQLTHQNKHLKVRKNSETECIIRDEYQTVVDVFVSSGR
jgi:hypothetical protein